ncbi:MAG: GNAT family N-acetyltransferase [Arachnia sp.]
MSTRVRVLGPRDRTAVTDFLALRPVETLFLAAKISSFGLDRRRVGVLHGFERDNELAGVCLDGGTVFPATHDPEAIPRFVEVLGPVRRASSILGPSQAALGLYVGLSERWPGAWASVSNVRQRQPLMLLDAPPTMLGDERVRALTPRDFGAYLDASVKMYTEEIGSSPFKHGPGYESFVQDRLRHDDAYGIVEDGEVLFKADLGPRLGSHTQLQGVWVRPDQRGKRLAVSALASMLRRVMTRYTHVSLYVNDFNTPAVKVYQRLGFETVGSLSTVHY